MASSDIDDKENDEVSLILFIFPHNTTRAKFIQSFNIHPFFDVFVV